MRGRSPWAICDFERAKLKFFESSKSIVTSFSLFESFWIYSNLFKSVHVMTIGSKTYNLVLLICQFLNLQFHFFQLRNRKKFSGQNSWEQKFLRAILSKLQTESRQIEYQMKELIFWFLWRGWSPNSFTALLLLPTLEKLEN